MSDKAAIKYVAEEEKKMKRLYFGKNPACMIHTGKSSSNEPIEKAIIKAV